VAVGLTVGFALLAVPIALSNGRELLRRAAEIRPLALAVPMVLTILSYAAMSRSYQGIAGAAGTGLPFRTWLRITFVSNTVNYMVTSAGLSGFAVRLYLLRQQGVLSNRAVLISLVQTFLTNFTLLLFIGLGFVGVVLHGTLGEAALGAASFAVVVFTAVLAWATLLVFHRRLRRRTLFFFADATHRLLRRTVPRWTPGRVHLWRFQHDLSDGLDFLFARKDRMLGPTAWILLDWLLTLTILWAAFRAVNHPIRPEVVVIGFAVGICLSLVSIVPGGLGVMETGMFAVFVSLGEPAEATTLAVLVFRVAYYLVPIVVSLFFFHGLMLKAAHDVREPGAARFDTPVPPSL
jgi:glycosyltransferase 2 family protein